MFVIEWFQASKFFSPFLCCKRKRTGSGSSKPSIEAESSDTSTMWVV
jgi:hypothetical protein